MDYNDDEIVELPCEFCEVLYPWSLLAEHQIVCELNPEVLDFVPFENSITVEDPRIKEDKEVKQAQVLHVPYAEDKEVKQAQVLHVPYAPEKPVLKPTEKISAEPIVPIELPKVATKNIENQQNQVKRFTSQTEEFMTKTGEKLLVYGANLDPVEDLDAEKQSSKILNPLTSNIPKEEDVEDINNLSDDDCEETLEDFWKRARDFLKRNKTKIES